MNTRIFRYGFVSALVIGTVCCCFGTAEQTAPDNTDESIVVQGNNRFALDLYAGLRASEGTLFCSPYSISTALAMAYAGAEGQTEQQMARVMNFPVLPDAAKPPRTLTEKQFHAAFGAIIEDLNSKAEKGGYELSVANALWGQKGYGFLKEYLELIKVDYDGQLNEVDFLAATEHARQTINAWIEEKTKEKIKDLIKPGTLNTLTRLVLTNAIYFKGQWASKFEKDRTADAPFHLLGGGSVAVPMMNQTSKFGYTENGLLQVVQMPYVGDDLSMVILLPKKTDGITELEKSLTPEKLADWLCKLHKRDVIVSVPKFTITSEFSLAAVLASMGMTDAFNPQAADFSGMNGKRNLFISAVLHKAFVEVNEEGTEAAAATGVVVGVTSVGPRQMPVFRADHPFLFLIRDNHSGSVLFLGRVLNPNE